MNQLRKCVWTLLLLTLALSTSWSQDDGLPQPATIDADSPIVVDQEANSQNMEDPPTSQPDSASIDPLPESRSLLLVGVSASQSLEANPGNNQGPSSLSSTTRAVGSLDLLKIAHRFQTAIDYRGGGFFSVGDGSIGHGQLQQLQAEEQVTWHKAALTFSDSFGNVPGGSFGSTWLGGAGAYNLGTTNVGAGLAPDPASAEFIGGGGFAGFGQRSLTNVSLLELTEALTPRSNVTVAGGYGFNHYFGNSPDAINGQQVSALADYGYLLSPRSQFGLTFGYRSFHFPEKDAGHIADTLVQVDYGRVISRRLQLQIGAGPEFSRIITPIPVTFVGSTININYVTDQVNVSANASLAYKVRGASMSLSYERLVTNGSGLFAGANTNTVEFALGRRLISSWDATFTAGYLSLSRINQSVSLIPGSSYEYGFAGAAVKRSFGRFNVLASYQFNDENVNTYSCQGSHPCSDFVQRHVILVGIYWHTRPIHLDSGGTGEGDITDGRKSNANDSDTPSSDK